MTIAIRPLTPQDADSVHALTRQLGYAIALPALRQQIAAIETHPDHQAFVAEASGEIIGFLHACKSLRLTTSPFFEIVGLVVAEKARRQGIGNRLVLHVEQQVMGCDKLRVRCNRRRVEAHQFYKKMGYLERKEQKVFEKRVDADGR